MEITRGRALIFAALFSGLVAATLMLCTPNQALAAQESEPNDSFATADSLTIGTTMRGQSIPATQSTWVSYEGPGDYYRIAIPISGQYKITFANENYEDIPTWSTSMKLTIYNQYYEKVDNVYANYNTTRASTKSLYMTKGTAYLHVEDGWLSSMNTHQYRIKVSPVINKTSITKLTAGKKSATVKFRKMLGSTRYEIRYAKNSKMSGAKKVTVKASKSSAKISKLQKNKKYYFQVRVVKKISGKTFYSNWSTKKSVKITR